VEAALDTPGKPIEMAEIRGAVARGWCADKNQQKVLDGDLAEAISLEVASSDTPEDVDDVLAKLDSD
jgi:hypothetical protein